MNNSKLIWGAIAITVVIALLGLKLPAAKAVLGAVTGVTNYDTLGITGLKLGSGCNDSYTSCSGSTFTKKLKGTCTLVTSGLPLVATSTGTFTCSATGVTSGDSVQVNLNANPTAFGSFAVVSAIAATDSITVQIANFTGASTSSFPLATTSAVWNAEI